MELWLPWQWKAQRFVTETWLIRERVIPILEGKRFAICENPHVAPNPVECESVFVF